MDNLGVKMMKWQSLILDSIKNYILAFLILKFKNETTKNKNQATDN